MTYSTITIKIPSELDHCKADLDRFIKIMIEKLYKHRGKGHWDKVDLMEAYVRLTDEATELLEAMQADDSYEVHREAADVANFAMIISSIVNRENPIEAGDKW